MSAKVLLDIGLGGCEKESQVSSSCPRRAFATKNKGQHHPRTTEALIASEGSGPAKARPSEA